MRILLLDDDEDHLELLRQYLVSQKFSVDQAASASEANEYLQLSSYDLLILDWSLPDFSGVELCRRYRASGGMTPVLFLTGKSDIVDVEEGLDAGGDDYLTKPFEPRELLARVRALLRRPTQIQESIIKIRDIELNAAAHSVTKNGEAIKLYPKEYELFELLVKNPNRVYSAEKLLDIVWSNECDVSSDTLRQTISRLRSAIGHDNSCPLIRTIHGVGYRLEP